MTCENQPEYTCADSRGWDWPKASRVPLTGVDSQPKKRLKSAPQKPGKMWPRVSSYFGSPVPERGLVRRHTAANDLAGYLGSDLPPLCFFCCPVLMALPSAWYTEVFVGRVGFVLTAPLKNPRWDLLALLPVCSVHLPHFLSRLQCAVFNTGGCKLNSCRAFSQ